MARHNAGLRQQEMNVEHVLLPHNNGPKTNDVGIARVQHHHVRLVLLQIGRHLVTPDGIPGKIERLLSGMTQHHATGLSQPLRQLRHGVSAIGPVLSALGFRNLNIAEEGRVGHDRQVAKPLAAQQRGVTVVLHVDRFIFGDQLRRGAIPVIVMGMGDDHRVGVQQRVHVNGEFDRRVTAFGISSVTPGALVTAQQDTALATVRGLDSMYVDLTRSSADLLRLRKQTLATNSDTLSVSLILEDGSTYSEKGRLALTEVAVDESTGSVTLRAVFPNPQHQLLPGMFVRARVDEGVMSDAILAPQQGITRDAKGAATALVVNASSKVEQRQLETGDTYGDKWLVLSGLKAGDKLIVEGTDKVAAGQEVKAEEMKASGGNA